MRKKYSPIQTESIQAFMTEALVLARQARDEDEVPVGAVIVGSGVNGVLEVVGRGYNRREQDQDPIAHAEILAIQSAARRIGSWRLEGCAAFVTLEPCPMCLSALQQARVEAVFFGTRDPKGGALSLGYCLHQDQRTNHRFEVEHVDFPEAARILKDFFARKRTSV